QLTEKVRQRPYSVVLLDEIEKAHPDVFSLLLQVFDDGRLTDSWGHVVDFRNTVIILTSNAGTRRVKQGGTMGFQAQSDEIDYEKMKERVLAEVKKVFNPEFINRLDELVVFHPLTHADIDQIINIMLARLNKRLEEKNFTLRLDDAVRTTLVNKGHDPEYGARPLRRVLQNHIEDPLSLMLISAEIPEGSEVVAHLEEDGETIRFEVVAPDKQEKPEPALSGTT
ncbi:MAG: AAA family ATPase, partial [Candidatus Sumerlaeia bacterium]|nr:AAA family ATPase [Candidatus Sumerlaeia bacterium]